VLGRSAGATARLGPVREGLAERYFTADARPLGSLADINEHCARESKLYLCANKDVYFNRIVGYSIDSRMKLHIAVAVLDNAVARRRTAGVAGYQRASMRGGLQERAVEFHALRRGSQFRSEGSPAHRTT